MIKNKSLFVDEQDPVLFTSGILPNINENTGFNFGDGGKMRWFFDTYTVSNEQKCYNGEIFPYDVPNCELRHCVG